MLNDKKVLVQTNKYESYDYGDKISISGKFKVPEKFDEKFNYPKYLQKDGILYTSFYPEINIIEKESQIYIPYSLNKITKEKYGDQMSFKKFLKHQKKMDITTHKITFESIVD